MPVSGSRFSVTLSPRVLCCCKRVFVSILFHCLYVKPCVILETVLRGLLYYFLSKILPNCRVYCFWQTSCHVSYFLFVSVDADYKMCSSRRRGGGKDVLADLLHNQQVPLRICADGRKIKCCCKCDHLETLFSEIIYTTTNPFLASVFFVLSKVFDNYAVTVMIGGEPYTLGLFDTAGKCL